VGERGWQFLEPGAVTSLPFCIGKAEMADFLRLSSDTNPIHTDVEFAQRHGFDGLVVYGGLIVAQISCLLGTRVPGPGCVWRSLSIRFRSPLRIGEPAVVSGTISHANADLGVVELRLRVEAGGRLIAEGEASAQLAAVRERTDA
jgi:3-hydroxybutyryl-CoA dehydratase